MIVCTIFIVCNGPLWHSNKNMYRGYTSFFYFCNVCFKLQKWELQENAHFTNPKHNISFLRKGPVMQYQSAYWWFVSTVGVNFISLHDFLYTVHSIFHGHQLEWENVVFSLILVFIVLTNFDDNINKVMQYGCQWANYPPKLKWSGYKLF